VGVSDTKGGNAVKMISDEVFHRGVALLWDKLGFFAYDRFHRYGRGAVGIDEVFEGEGPGNLQLSLLYTVYDPENGKLESRAAGMNRDYDPKWEMVVQYVRADGSVRTMRLRTKEGARHPWRIWLFEALG